MSWEVWAMSSKISFFSSSIFKANMKRFWWISACLFVAVLTFALLPLIEYGYNDGFNTINVLAIGYSIIVPPLLFSYLNSANSVTCMHAFPIKRSTHYITNIISLAVILFVPVIIGFLIGQVVSYNGYTRERLEMCEIFCMNFVMVIIFSGASLLGIMVTGNTVAAIAFGAIFAGFPYYSEIIFKFFLEQNIYGIWGNDVITIQNFRPDKFNTFMGVMLGIGIVCYIVAWLLYKYRKLESNGDIIAFKWLKPVFIAGVSVYMGFLGYFYLSNIFTNNIFFMLPFGILGIIIAYMLSKKAFTLKGVWKPALIYIAAVFVLFAVVEYDITGFERRIPDIDDVASVNVAYEQFNEDDYNESESYREFNGKEYYFVNPKYLSEYAFTEKEDIQNVMNLHKYLIELKPQYSERSTSTSLPVVYKLKNGNTIKRVYPISFSQDKEYLEPVFTTDLMRNKQYPFFDYEDATLESISITDDRMINGVANNKIFTGTSPEAAALINAIREDIKNLSYETLIYENRGATHIDIAYRRPIVNDKNEPVTSNDVITNVSQFSSGITISPEFTNTVKLLYQYGIFDNTPTVDDITKAAYRIDGGEPIEITDRAQIEELYSYCAYNNCIPERSNRRYYANVKIEFYSGENVILTEDYYSIDESTPKLILDECKKLYPDEDDLSKSGMDAAVETEEVIIIN